MGKRIKFEIGGKLYDENVASIGISLEKLRSVGCCVHYFIQISFWYGWIDFGVCIW
jgi:hypothetical protein